MKIKKRNGFTLVELLVTIALMLTILGIAIVSVVNVNNNKKQEAWNLVKEQIETAAEDYFAANEYLFEGLTDDQNSNAQISVGTLVKEDYLNKVTNPVTGEEISSCSIVNVKKEGGALTATFDEGTINSELTECDDTKDITISDVPKKDIPLPDFDVSYFKDSNCSSSVSADSTGWFNINKLGENKPLYVKVSPKEGSKVSNVEVNVGGNVIQSYNKLNDGAYCVQLADEGDVSYDVTAYGPGGNKTIVSSYQKDTIRPQYSTSIAYKVYNIDNYSCSNNPNKTKNGVYCGQENGTAFIKWDNNAIEYEDYKFYNIRGFYVAFPEIEDISDNNIEFYINNSGTETNNERGSCKRVDNNRFDCDLSAYDSVNQIKIVFKGKTLSFVDDLDSAGFNIIVKDNHIANNGSISLQKNFSQFTRLGSVITDGINGSGYASMKIYSNTKNIKNNFKDISGFVRRDGTDSRINLAQDQNSNSIWSGSFLYQDIYTIKVLDKAGNETNITLNTNNKFN